jgi:hypothetical protein
VFKQSPQNAPPCARGLVKILIDWWQANTDYLKSLPILAKRLFSLALLTRILVLAFDDDIRIRCALAVEFDVNNSIEIFI